MKKYDKYKSSGVEWLGAVPEQWEVKRIKNITKSLIGGGTPSTEKDEYWDGIIPWVSAKDMKFDRIIESVDYITEKAIKESSTNLIKPNRILFVARSGILKHTFPVAINSVPVAINQDLKALEPNKLVSVEFLLRCFKGLSSNILMKCQKVGATVDSLEIQEFLNFSIPIPPLPEQSLIATFLDQKTSSIDQKISLLQQKSFHYKDLRKSLINETICRGLNKNVKFKDSGIKWIGKIPEHWTVKRFKDIANTVKGKNLEFSDTHFENSLPNLSLDYLRNTDVDPVFCFSNDKSYKVTSDDYIIIWDGAGVGEILNGKTGFLSSTIAKIVINKKVFNRRFFFHLKDNIEYTLKRIPAGMGIPHLNPQVLNSYMCPLPPLSEHSAIATYLDEKTQKIDSILTNIASQIETLKELRKTLINDVVTGKLKVTDND